jgi:lysozyme family protein
VVAVNFQKAYEYCLIDEAGKDDDPDDRGGRTCDGITQDEYSAWCRVHGQPFGDVWNISDPTKQAIYYINYWQPWCDRLPDGIDYLWFDAKVNSGPREATLFLQRAMNFNARQADGVMGLYTAQRAVDWSDKTQLITAFCAHHRAFYELLVKERPVDEKFIRGWLNRIDHEMTNAHSIIALAGARTQA